MIQTKKQIAKKSYQKHRASRIARVLEYQKTEAGKKVRSKAVAKYSKTKAGKESEKRKQDKYNKTPKSAARYRKYRLKTKYKITPTEWEILFMSQGKCCAICKIKECERWHTDHNHETELVRGILCQNCNIAIGQMKDSPSRLREAALYLEKYS